MRFSTSVSLLAAVLVGTTSVLANDYEESDSVFARDVDMELEARQEAIENYVRELEYSEALELISRELADNLAARVDDESAPVSQKPTRRRGNRRVSWNRGGRNGGRNGERRFRGGRVRRPKKDVVANTSPVSDASTVTPPTDASPASAAPAEAAPVAEAVPPVSPREVDESALVERGRFGGAMRLGSRIGKSMMGGRRNRFGGGGRGNRFGGGRSRGSGRFGGGGRRQRRPKTDDSTAPVDANAAPPTDAAATPSPSADQPSAAPDSAPPVSARDAVVLDVRDFLELNEELEARFRD